MKIFLRPLLKTAFEKKLFFFFLLLLPTQIGYHFWLPASFIFGLKVDYFSPTVYFTDLVLFLLFLLNIKRVNLSKNFFLAAIYFLFLSMFVAKNQLASLILFFRFLEVSFLAWYVSGMDFKNGLEHLLVKIPIFISLIYVSILGIWQVKLGHSVGGLFWFFGERKFSVTQAGIALQSFFGQDILRAYSTFPHPNALAGFMVVGFLFSVSILKKYRFLNFFVFLFFLCFILTFSKAAYFSLLFVFFFYLFSKISLRASLLFSGLILSLEFFFLVFLGKYFPNLELRNDLAKAGLMMLFPHNILFGVGLNNFLVELPFYGLSPSVSWWLQPIHNIFLLILVETGIVGFLVFLLFGLKIFLRSFKKQYFLLPSSIFFILSTGMFDHYWLTLHQNQLLLGLVLGLVLAKD